MEHTGIYNNLLLKYLHPAGYAIWVENARQIKLSGGMTRGKSDKVDAQRIACYAFRHQEEAKLWKPKRVVVEKLSVMLKNRKRLIKIKNQLSVYAKEGKRFLAKEITHETERINRKVLFEAKKAIDMLDEEILVLIRSDSQLISNYKLVKSVEGVGPVIAATVLVKTNEFTDHKDGRRFACQAGVAPFEHTSGTSIRGRTKVSHMADKSIKTLFHLAAMAVVTKKRSELKDFYERKIAEGKNKMSVLNAIRNKIIHRIFAVVKRGTPYQKFNTFALVNP